MRYRKTQLTIEAKHYADIERTAKDPAEKMDANARFTRVSNDLDVLIRAFNVSTTNLGQGLQSVKYATDIQDDFVTSMVRARVTGGKPVSAELRAQLEDITGKLEQVKKESAAVQEKLLELQAQDRLRGNKMRREAGDKKAVGKEAYVENLSALKELMKAGCHDA